MCTGQEKTLLDCPHSGWGENSCDHSRDAGVSCLQQGLPQILEVGCYQDKSDDRALNKLYANLRSQIDWWNMRSMVTKCAERAFVRGYKYFGVQFYGECWGDDRLRPSYDKHGPGKGCTDGELGSGRPGGGGCSAQRSKPFTLLYKYHFWQKRSPFPILSMVKWYSFLIPTLELCIFLNYCKCTACL